MSHLPEINLKELLRTYSNESLKMNQDLLSGNFNLKLEPPHYDSDNVSECPTVSESNTPMKMTQINQNFDMAF